MLKEKIYDFIKNETYAVVSTTNRAGHPESALVGFSQTESLEIVFATQDKTRKIENILHNPNVAIAIGPGDKKYTGIQIEGSARVVRVEDADEYADAHYKKIPSARPHKEDEGECFVIVTPSWARYTDVGSKPEEVIEDYLDAD